jgi:hypothetical protein
VGPSAAIECERARQNDPAEQHDLCGESRGWFDYTDRRRRNAYPAIAHADINAYAIPYTRTNSYTHEYTERAVMWWTLE